MTKIALMLARLAGALTLVLGAAHAFGLGPVLQLHMIGGTVFVLALWALVFTGFRAAPKLAVLAFNWGVVVVAFGIFQLRLVPGEYHWTMQLLHLLLGLSAMAQAERLGAAIKRREAGTAAG
ncbi:MULTISPECIES: hypothetical protein [Rubrivivax]|nr:MULTISPECIES: hypothetical protein [Rubrivivax]EGJ09863.1 hypothetical protein RBXJA2T_06020 [Rubrivivax benzoatilyticus JA2 = ATCC BAA-35]MCC9595462.1 hypothetical protein [Rubrivivax sp. JA1055]MCC9647031.1 hypothetical protein [Rubrivivax sp. JA1029]MCD0420967.1 hypothetical protein [Rubrivivax sp. JA1024]